MVSGAHFEPEDITTSLEMFQRFFA